MARALSFTIFFTIAVAIVGLAHWYLWARLVRDPGWPAGLRQAGTFLVIALGIGLPLGMVLSRVLDGAARPLVWALYVWMGLMFILTVVLLAGDAVRLVASAGERLLSTANAATVGGAPDPDRRLFFARLWAGAAFVGSAGAGAWGMRRALSVPPVKDVRIELARLPHAMSGTTVVQLTDLHIGSLLDGDWLAAVVDRVNALQPDLVAITGDLVDGSVPSLRDAVAHVGRLRAPLGVYFVTGNHEYYSGVDAWARELSRLGVRVLRNERVAVGTAEAGFDLAGINDASAGRFDDAPDLPAALEGRDPKRELVLLAHQPKAVYEACERGVGLQLSGHTHGGQIWPWGYAVRLTQPFVAGKGRMRDTQVYTSCGTGFWGPPMRIAAGPEITRLVLVSPAAGTASRS